MKCAANRVSAEQLCGTVISSSLFAASQKKAYFSGDGSNFWLDRVGTRGGMGVDSPTPVAESASVCTTNL